MGKVKVIWINSVTVGVTKHIIYRDDIEVGQVVVADPSIFYDESPIAGVTHKYEVQAVNANGTSTDESVGINVINMLIPDIPTVPPSGTAPTLFNFRILDGQTSRMYFDSSISITGISSVGFTISDKSIVGIQWAGSGQTQGHYFTVDTPFTFWDNNTIRLENGNNIIYDFTLSYITNNIAEPTTKVKTVWVNNKATGAADGTSEADAFTTLQAGLNSTVAGGWLLNLKATDTAYTDTGIGAASGANNGYSGGINSPGVVQGYKTTPGDLNGVMYYAYGDGALDSTEMPLFDGGDRTDGATFFNPYTDNYRIFRNIQITGYGKGFSSDTTSVRQGQYIDNCLFKDIGNNTLGGTGQSDGMAVGLKSNSNAVSTCRVKDCIAINMTSEAFTMAGDHNLFIDSKCYCNESSTDSQFASTDYYFILNGKNNIIKNTLSHRDIPTSPQGHFGHTCDLKGSIGGDTQYNLVDGNEAISIYDSFGANYPTTQYNVFKNNISRANVGNRPSSTVSSAGLRIGNGASDNVWEFHEAHDVDQAISFQKNNDTGDAASKIIGHDNIIRNSVFYNCKTVIYALTTTNDASGTNSPSGNLIYNCTFYNCDYLYRTLEPASNLTFASDNLITNCIFQDVTTLESDEALTGWTWDHNNFYSSWTNSKGTNSINQDSQFVDVINFVPQNVGLKVAPLITGVEYDKSRNERELITWIGAETNN